MTLRFFVPGPPVGKGRPRVAMHGGHAHAYTPDRTADYEWLVRHCYKGQCAGAFAENTPVSVEIVALYPIAKSATKAERAAMLAGEILPTKKPDVDNVLKIILDALNGLAYPDDKQVVYTSVRKKYAEEPGVWVTLEG